jgi:hypothetical protein
MSKDNYTDIIKPIVSSMRKILGENDKIEKIIYDIDISLSGIKKAYLNLLKQEQAEYLPNIKLLTDELGLIFDSINDVICSDCALHKNKLVDGRNTGCCIECYSSIGHFNHNYDDDSIPYRKAIGELKDKFGWDHVHGFLGKDKCMLPREYRSVTCLSHMCNELASKLTDVQRTRVRDIIDEIKRLKRSVKATLI